MKIIALMTLLSSLYSYANCDLKIITENASGWKVERSFESLGFNIVDDDNAVFKAYLTKKRGIDIYRGQYYRELFLVVKKGDKVIIEERAKDIFPANFTIYMEMRTKIRRDMLSCLESNIP